MEQLNSRELLPDTSIMYKLHDSAMNIVGESGVVRPAPDSLSARTHLERIQHSQYSGGARGSQPPEGSIFLPCCFAFVIGCCRATWKAKSTPRMLSFPASCEPSPSIWGSAARRTIFWVSYAVNPAKMITPMMLIRICFGNTLLTVLLHWFPGGSVVILKSEITEKSEIWYDTSRSHAKYRSLYSLQP